jgi:hypothetical protein
MISSAQFPFSRCSDARSIGPRTIRLLQRRRRQNPRKSSHARLSLNSSCALSFRAYTLLSRSPALTRPVLISAGGWLIHVRSSPRISAGFWLLSRGIHWSCAVTLAGISAGRTLACLTQSSSKYISAGLARSSATSKQE